MKKIFYPFLGCAALARQTGAKMYRNPHGFSLIELLISLIIISVITSALSPVITKHLQKNTIGLASEKITYKCSDKFGADCKLCSKKECLICQKTASLCPLGQFLDLSNCACANCATGGYCKSCDDALSCKTCPANRVLENGKCTKICETGFFAPDNNTYTSCKNCNQIHANCTKCTENGCIECNGDYEAINGVCLEKSARCIVDYNGTTYIIPNAVKYTSNGKTYCMTATNIGDGAYSDIPVIAGISPITSPNGVCYSRNKCCFKHGATSGANSMPDPNPGFDYAPQGRTLCNWWAALTVCPKISSPISGKDWHLPSFYELEYLKAVIDNEANDSCSTTATIGNIQKCAGKMGLQLCTYDSGYGSPKCSYSSYCNDYDNPNYAYLCTPAELWTSTEINYHNANGASFNSGKLKLDINFGYGKSFSRSVRCVLGPF